MRLEYEWRRQAELCYKWGQLEADAEREVDSLKNRLEVCQANLDLDIRRDPVKFNLTSKVTETLIANRVTTDEIVIGLQEELVEAKHTLNSISATLKAIEHKAKALDNAVRLYLSGYWSSRPDIEDDKNEAVRRAKDDAIREQLKEDRKRRSE